MEIIKTILTASLVSSVIVSVFILPIDHQLNSIIPIMSILLVTIYIYEQERREHE